MEYRGEPRFPVRSSIRVIIPGDDPRTIDSQLIDISGTGLRFLSPAPIDSEMVVAIEVDSRLVLCEIRYCQDRGDRYVVGARRLHEIAKDAQLADTPAVVTEMLGHLRRHIAAANAEDSQKMAVRQLEQIVERGSENPESLEMPRLVPEPVAVPEPIVEPEVLTIEAIQEPPVAEIEERDSAQPHAPAPPLLPVQTAPVDPLEAARQALGSNESALAAVSRDQKISWQLMLAIAASLILAALLVFFLFQRRTEAKSTPLPAAAIQPAPAAPAPAAAHHARIHILRPAWISLSIDGAAATQPVLKQNDLWDFEFSKNAILRIADGSSIEITIDANSIGPIASGPQILNLRGNGVEVMK
ncbi:MAG TPA: PilZ domain-containing protein [Bryobacteraceae bacterium]|jgi:hypothetical protein|nr:PilZ domain-containing protein [Bryobacteraceae bacterium]